MNRLSSFPRLFALLGLLALLCAQASGVTRGYLCGMSGQAKWTLADHCHGEVAQEDSRAQSLHDEQSAGDRHEHEVLRDDLRGRQTPALELPAWVAILVAMVQWESAPTRVVIQPIAKQDVDAGMATGVAVARTVVFLI